LDCFGFAGEGGANVDYLNILTHGCSLRLLLVPVYVGALRLYPEI
jgi:hypothetical protein